MMELRTRLQELDAHFANADFKFYYVRDPDPRLVKDPETLVKRSKQNVLVETLTAGRLGLPEIAGPTFIEPELGVIILHPSILILTKFKRWSSSRSSTRPQTLKKFRTDQQDIIFLIQWLASEELKIEFDKYIGKPKDELLRMVLTFHRKFEEEDPELVETLESVVHPEDWQALLLLSPLEVESHIPPSDA